MCSERKPIFCHASHREVPGIRLLTQVNKGTVAETSEASEATCKIYYLQAVSFESEMF